jgi:hypothetical protein
VAWQHTHHDLSTTADSDTPLGPLQHRLYDLAGREGARAASPGRALQGVRDKLHAFLGGGQQQQQAAGSGDGGGDRLRQFWAPASAPEQQQVGGSAVSAGAALPASQVFEDAGSELADIDARLAGLQEFLRRAKAGAAAG